MTFDRTIKGQFDCSAHKPQKSGDGVPLLLGILRFVSVYSKGGQGDLFAFLLPRCEKPDIGYPLGPSLGHYFLHLVKPQFRPEHLVS